MPRRQRRHLPRESRHTARRGATPASAIATVRRSPPRWCTSSASVGGYPLGDVELCVRSWHVVRPRRAAPPSDARRHRHHVAMDDGSTRSRSSRSAKGILCSLNAARRWAYLTRPAVRGLSGRGQLRHHHGATEIRRAAASARASRITGRAVDYDLTLRHGRRGCSRNVQP